MKIYAIAGTFYQETTEPLIVYAAEAVGGTHVELVAQQMSHTFSGYFAIINKEMLEIGHGVMIDTYGPSALSILEMEDDKFIFQKSYERSENIVSYFMQRGDSGVWTGRYHSLQVGEGDARCLLTELPEALFNIIPETVS